MFPVWLRFGLLEINVLACLCHGNFFLFPSIVADSCAGNIILVLMAMSEEEQVVSEVQDVSPPRGSSLMGKSHLGKATGL